MVDARLTDGSRVNAVIPPLALDGSLVSIRRVGANPILVSDLLAFKAITSDMIQFLSACIKSRVNMIISGGTGSGKTTLLNALSAYVPESERVVTIEDAAELKMQQPHVARMETRPANIEGVGEVTTRDLVRNALRMRPDRIIVGECRGPEALDMLQAMNTGHDGSLTTIHANETRDALSRLEMMVGMAGFDLPIWIIRRQIASAIQIVVQVARLAGGARKVIKISEVTGMEGDVISMHDLFSFKQTGVDKAKNAQGYYEATGLRPACLKKLEISGAGLPIEMFEPPPHQRVSHPGEIDLEPPTDVAADIPGRHPGRRLGVFHPVGPVSARPLAPSRAAWTRSSARISAIEPRSRRCSRTSARPWRRRRARG